jgi:hypothetical protein
MNRLYYIFGAFIPIPLFFDLYSLSFFVQLLNSCSMNCIPVEYAAGSYYGISAPVPIGIITFALVVFLSVFSIKEKILAISVEVLTLVFVLMFFIVLSISNIGIVKTIMLLFPFVCMFFAVGLTKNIGAYKKIGSGYIASFVFFILLHALSTLYLNINGITGTFFLFNSIFGIQIYQASVSYSAVLSYAAVTLLFFIIFKSTFSPKVIFFIIIIWFLLSLGARKAVLLDISILYLLFFFSICIRSAISLKIKKKFIILPFLPILFYVAFSFSNFSSRDVSLDYALSQRAENYEVYFELMGNADLTQLLLGFGGSWGGFSNFYIEMIVRLGFLGFLLYVIAFLIGLLIVRKHIKYLFNFNNYDNYFLLWLWFTILTLVLSNLFNMNLQLPYYSMNFTMIMMIFLYRTKTIST